jgi:hypothetical protein
MLDIKDILNTIYCAKLVVKQGRKAMGLEE